MRHAHYRSYSMHWGWLIGLLFFVLLFSGAFRFILPFLLVGGFFFFILPRILDKAQSWGSCARREHGQRFSTDAWHGWGGARWERRYQEEKRKRDFERAEDVHYTEKPRREDADRVEYVVGPDGELEPVRVPYRDDYV